MIDEADKNRMVTSGRLREPGQPFRCVGCPEWRLHLVHRLTHDPDKYQIDPTLGCSWTPDKCGKS